MSQTRAKATAALVEAAIKWRDEHAFQPPPTEFQEGWVREELTRRHTAADTLRHAIDVYERMFDGG